MSELHDFPYTEYESGGCCNNLGCMMAMCHRVGVKLAFNNGVLELLDRANHVISTVQIAYSKTAAEDINGNPLIAYLISAGVRDKFLVLRNGNGQETILTIPYAETAKYTEAGDEITSYLKSFQIVGDQVSITQGDGTTLLYTIPFATKAATDVNSKNLTTYAAGIAVSGNDIILTDGMGNVINTIRCHFSDLAAADENGNNLRTNYAAQLITGTTTLKLISKAGDVLSEITVPYSQISEFDKLGNKFVEDYGSSLVIDIDGKRVGLESPDGTRLSTLTVPFSTVATDATNAIESVTISGNEIIFQTFGGVQTRITCPYSVKSLRDGNNNEISKTYIADVQQNSVTGEITFYDAEGTAIVAITPNSAHATYDSYDNLIADFIKTVTYDLQNDYFIFTTGTGATTTITCGYSEKAYKDLRNNAIHDTYIAFVTNVVDGNGDWVMVFYNGEGSEKFRLKVVANKAQRDADGNIITEFYVHSLTINGDTISYNDANGTAIGSITLPKYVAGMEWEYPSESFWYRTYDIDGNTLQRIKFPIQSWLRLGLVQTDKIQLQDFDNEELNSGRSTVHLPEYYYDAEISGTNLLLKDIHGNTRTTLALPGSADTAEFDLNEDTLFKIRQGTGNCYYANASAPERLYQAVVPEVHNYKDANGYIRARAIFARPYLQSLGMYKEFAIDTAVSSAAGEIHVVSYNTTPTKDFNPFPTLQVTKIGSRSYNGFIEFAASIGSNTVYPNTLPDVWYIKSNPNKACLLSIPRLSNVAIMGQNSLSTSDTIVCHKSVPLLSGLLDIQLYNDVECQHVIYGQNVTYTEDGNHNMFVTGIVNATRVTISVLNDTTGAVIRSRTTNIFSGGFMLPVQTKASGESEMVQLTFINDNAPVAIQERMKVTCYIQMPSGYNAKTT